MGLCLSKKELQKEKISSPTSPPSNPNSDSLPQQKEKTPIQVKEEKPSAEVKKQQTAVATNPNKIQENKKEEKVEEPKRIEIAPKEEHCNSITAAVRTSSCTKEEVDAILIQCGRLSRSSSGKGSNENNGRGSKKYAGSKRSFDFDHDSTEKSYDDEEKPQIRTAHMRTRSRERDVGASELKRSSSRDEGRKSGSRRASRSPGRRQETPTEKSRPGKMVSVPATVSTARETGTGVRKVSTAAAKRSGEVRVRSSASPRARSPANNRASNENIHQNHHSQQSLSRNSSRKAEQSPCRRNPMSEIDENILRTDPQPPLKNHEYNKSNSNKMARSKEGEEGQKGRENVAQTSIENERNIRTVEIPHGSNSNSSRGIRKQLMNSRVMEQQQKPEIVEEVTDTKESTKSSDIAATNHGTEGLIPQTITKSRSSRRSRDLDLGMGLNPDTLLNPSSYASLLLDDIQNYHNQNAAFSLPPCVSKACSILEAVADLNSCTSSNLSPAFSEEKSSGPDRPNHYNNHNSFNGRFNRKLMEKDPFVESEVVVNDNDLMEPSLHKYVTVRDPGRDMEQQESAGSNSFIGHHWASSWEPNSADSTDRWTSLSNTGEEVEQQQQAMLETAQDFEAGVRRLRRGVGNSNSMMSGKKREIDGSQQQLYVGSGGNGKVGLRSFSIPPVVAAAAVGQ